MGTFGSRVKEMRELRQLNVTQAAKLAKIAQPSWRAIEVGETDPDRVKAATVFKIARVLRASPVFLLEGIGPATAETVMDPDELQVVISFRVLDPIGKGKVLGYIEREVQGRDEASKADPYRKPADQSALPKASRKLVPAKR